GFAGRAVVVGGAGFAWRAVVVGGAGFAGRAVVVGRAGFAGRAVGRCGVAPGRHDPGNLGAAGVGRVRAGDPVARVALVAGVAVARPRHLPRGVLVVRLADAARARLARRVAGPVAVAGR